MRLPKLPARKAALPAEVAELFGLNQRQVLAHSALVGGGHVAVTEAGLCAVTGTGQRVQSAWTEIDHLVWHPDSSTLAVFWVSNRLPTALEIEGESYVPEVVHERWRYSVLLTREVALGGRRRAWLAARRGTDGEITVQTNLSVGVDGNDPQVQQRLARARRDLLAEVGVGQQVGPLEPIRDPLA